MQVFEKETRESWLMGFTCLKTVLSSSLSASCGEHLLIRYLTNELSLRMLLMGESS